MDTYYFDWAHGRVDVLKNDEHSVRTYRSLDELLDSIHKPSRIIGEATFESFFRDTRRNDIIRRCEREGHELLTTPNRATGKWKAMLYPKEDFPHFYEKGAKFPDDLAVDIIRKIAKSGYHLKKPRVFDADDPWIARREKASREIMLLRNSKVELIGPRGGIKVVSEQDQLADEVIAMLPAFKDLHPRLQIGLGKGTEHWPTEYSKPIVASTFVIAKHVDNVREFDKLSGLYAHGYPTQFRSNYHYYGMKYAIGRHGNNKDTRRDFRYACRWLYHQVKGLTQQAGRTP